MNKAAQVALVVDDEVQIRRFLRAGFELEGFIVHEVATGSDGIRAATLKPADLVILDLGLPDMDGAEVVERLRTWSNVPIIVLSVRSSEDEKVRLLELGADDYVVKPFGMAELLARARAALRRHTRGATGEPVVNAGPLSIDLAQRTVSLDGERVQLSPKQYRLLQVPSTPAMSLRTSIFSRTCGALRMSTTPTICASSCAKSGIRSRRIRPCRKFSSRSSAWANGIWPHHPRKGLTGRDQCRSLMQGLRKIPKSAPQRLMNSSHTCRRPVRA